MHGVCVVYVVCFRFNSSLCRLRHGMFYQPIVKIAENEYIYLAENSNENLAVNVLATRILADSNALQIDGSSNYIEANLIRGTVFIFKGSFSDFRWAEFCSSWQSFFSTEPLYIQLNEALLNNSTNLFDLWQQIIHGQNIPSEILKLLCLDLSASETRSIVLANIVAIFCMRIEKEKWCNIELKSLF